MELFTILFSRFSKPQQLTRKEFDMATSSQVEFFNRRRLLTAGATVSAGVLASSLFGQSAFGAGMQEQQTGDDPWSPLSPDTVQEIQRIIQAEGMVSDGVLSIDIDRDDIPDVRKDGLPIKPSFQIHGTLVFQGIGQGRVAMNGDMALKANEIDGFIDQLIAHKIIFQAEHQHFYDLSPMVWFVHFRMFGDPITIARGVKAALDVTSTPFPQTSPQNPTTPLPADELGQILGATPTIGAGGVVSIEIPRREALRLGGIRINPYLNVASSVVFEPHGGGNNAVVAPDYALTASEINRVIGFARKRDWDIGCLYNQEVDEHPQLYFSHHFKVGNSVTLAREVRAALEMTNSKFK
jgi:hypothetical protein